MNLFSKSELSNPEIIIDVSRFSDRIVIGVDEVGRGCLAGPVFGGACVLKSLQIASELTDSKLISEKRREILAQQIESNHWVTTAFATVEEIDELNILRASQLAIARAIEELCETYAIKNPLVLVDGNQKIRYLSPDIEQYPLVKGDLRCAPISAAAIVAKVTRDNVMRELAGVYKGYGFEGHKGYGTKQHKTAIEQLGPVAVHRRSFSGVKEFLT